MVVATLSAIAPQCAAAADLVQARGQFAAELRQHPGGVGPVRHSRQAGDDQPMGRAVSGPRPGGDDRPADGKVPRATEQRGGKAGWVKMEPAIAASRKGSNAFFESLGSKKTHPALVAADDSIARAGKPESHEFTYHRPGDDRVKRMTPVPVPDGTGGVIQIGGMQIEVAELHRARVKVQGARGRLRALFRSGSGQRLHQPGRAAGITRQVIQFANQGMAKPCGLTAAPMIGLRQSAPVRRGGCAGSIAGRNCAGAEQPFGGGAGAGSDLAENACGYTPCRPPAKAVQCGEPLCADRQDPSGHGAADRATAAGDRDQ